ncbi:pseudouridine synthase [Halocynthiibacter namhaensis]|uniref:pseudouridine synthase n=1 Tax=Halocynthiibacter namhaensis TaxID=1290553 RepID=UPI00068CEA3C|nr:pseudouridine synthase [Halocynthiibacter namhaensis]
MTDKPNTPRTDVRSDARVGDRIAKVIARAGVASRRDAERLIADGHVTVNGKLIDSPALNVTSKDKITVKGESLAEPDAPRVWLYHKPTGLVTSARDEKGRDTVFDNLPEAMPRVMSVGRLDINSEGLLLLTNDGGLKRQMELPSTGWLRRYRVRVNGRPQDASFDPLRKGIRVEGEQFQPMQVTLDRQQGANAWLTVAIREGKNREIRRAMSQIGFEVNRLMRISYGPFQLNELKSGEVEELKSRVIRDQLGLDSVDEKPTLTQRRKPSQNAGTKPGSKFGGRSNGKPSSKPGASGKARGSKSQADFWAAAPDEGGRKPRGKSGSKPNARPTGGTSRPLSKGKPTNGRSGKGPAPRSGR